MDSLEAQWEKFSLSEVEGNTADLALATDSPKSYLAAKFLTRRVLNAEAVARTFTPLWRTDHGFTIRDMNENRLVFVFEDEADRERVMMGEPWAYDKYLIILQRIEEEEAIEDVVFRETSLWVQLHGLPVQRMNPEVANTLVSSLGRIEKISDKDTNADGGQAMRIRVRLDVTKPLCRGRKARLEKGRETWIFFKYERLPNFCYWCGLLSHSDKDCPKWLLNKEEWRAEDQQFGPWLRVVNERPWRKTEIKIDGICRPPNRKQPKTPFLQTTNPTPPTNTNPQYQTQQTPSPQPATNHFAHNTEPPTPSEKTNAPPPIFPNHTTPTTMVNDLQDKYDG